MKKVLRGIDSVGDHFLFAKDLSNSFFVALIEASLSFIQLFEEKYETPSIMTLLLHWIQSQISSYVEVFLKQVVYFSFNALEPKIWMLF